MKKFILFIIFCSSFLYAQDPGGIQLLTKDSWGRTGGNIYTWQATNDTAITSEGSALLLGLNIKTKATDKCSSSVRSPQKWMTHWTGNIIRNGSFASNLNEWTVTGTPPTAEQVASGGGFTGVLHVVVDNSGEGVLQDFARLEPSTDYRLIFSYNVTALQALNNVVFGVNYGGTTSTVSISTVSSGTDTIDFTTPSSPSSLFRFTIYTNLGLGTATFYADNISLIALTDSVQSSSQTLVAGEQVEFFWYHSLFYFTKGKTGVCAVDTFYSKADTDSFTTVTNRPTNFAVTGGTSHIDLSWVNASYIETGYAIERDTVTGGEGFVAIDTTAANTTSYEDTGVIEGGTYRYRMKTIASVNSAYSDIDNATVLSEEEFPEGLYITTPEGFYWTTSEGKYITGQTGD